MAADTQPYIRLSPVNQSDKVQIETEDEDRFLVTVGEAIRACKAFDKFADFHRQIRRVVAILSVWIENHKSQIAEAYLAVRDVGLLFLIVQNAKAFDQELEDSLTDLDVAIAQDAELNLIKLSVLALPRASEESIHSFLNLAGTDH
jgi:hypothetical protein